MSFTINYGAPGLIGVLLIVIAAMSIAIVASIVLRSAKIAHDEIVQEVEDDSENSIR